MNETELKKIEDKWCRDPIYLVLDVRDLLNEVKRLRDGIEECAAQAEKWTFPGSTQDTQPPVPEFWAAKLRALLQK